MKNSIKCRVKTELGLDNKPVPVVTLSFYSYDMYDKHNMAHNIIKNMIAIAKDMNISKYQLPSIDIQKKDYIEGLGQEFTALLYFMQAETDWFYFQFFKDIVGNYISDNFLRL